MKCWRQLNRARVAHDARPALSSYQSKCSKPGRSHHNSDICNLWSLTVLLICLHYDSTDWNPWSGQRRRPISDRVGHYRLLWGLYGAICVLQCGLIFLSTFYVLCSSQVCSDCANVAMNGKIKAIRHKVQCLLCSEVSECVNFTSMSEIRDRHNYIVKTAKK